MDKRMHTMQEALIASMKCVRQDLFFAGRSGAAEVKGDNTVVTPTDMQSEEAGKAILRKIPGVEIEGEETGSEGSGELLVYLDPLDGSKPFSAGVPTSTVIVAAINKLTRKVVACLVGEPQSGRIWRAEEGKGCEVCIPSEFLPAYLATYLATVEHNCQPVTVSGRVAEPIASRVFFDTYPGFTKSGRVIMTDSQVAHLHTTVGEQVAGFFFLGSNDIHHILVANGGDCVVGAVTTAIGGPWDVCAVLSVLCAGGHARAFSRMEDGSLKERDPLVVASYDILVTGNTLDTVNRLVACLI